MFSLFFYLPKKEKNFSYQRKKKCFMFFLISKFILQVITSVWRVTYI